MNDTLLIGIFQGIRNPRDQLKAEGRRKLLRELDPVQRKKLDELTGEKFEPRKRIR